MIFEILSKITLDIRETVGLSDAFRLFLTRKLKKLSTEWGDYHKKLYLCSPFEKGRNLLELLVR